MPRKQKKTLNKKTKLKNTVNVKINIDNSKKSTARRTPSKPANMQPFVNFPSFQPTRVQQLEPKVQFKSPDLTKTMDEYQKQFKTYLETKDEDLKKFIEKFDDTLKKNTAPPKKEDSKPGASIDYADDEGKTVFSQPIPVLKTSMFDIWSKPNEFTQNNMVGIKPDHFPSNKLFTSNESLKMPGGPIEAEPAPVEARLAT